MWLFEVGYQRVVDPQEGQRMLDAISNEVALKSAMSGASTWQAVRIPNVTRYENPFPEWLNNLLEQAGFEYNDINMAWHKRQLTNREAMAMMHWFEEVRRWAVQDPAWAQYMAGVVGRVHEENEWSEGVESF